MNEQSHHIRSFIPWLAVSLLILITHCTSAQDRFWVGLSGGLQNTYLLSSGRSEIDAQNAFRPNLLLNFEFRFSPKIALQTGLGYSLYTQKTSKFNNNFHYLIIPLHIKTGRFRKERKIALAYFVGVDFNYLLSAKNVYMDERSNIVEYTKRLHTEPVLGLGIKKKINEQFLVETYITGKMGGVINNASNDGFALINRNYGIMVSLTHIIPRSDK
ncbi:MAG: outer membrane beta-barrel protein [Bacteroidales bacterium]|nr:outer membrane beta-barrel protein [Bacteroidales bacterium]